MTTTTTTTTTTHRHRKGLLTLLLLALAESISLAEAVSFWSINGKTPLGKNTDTAFEKVVKDAINDNTNRSPKSCSPKKPSLPPLLPRARLRFKMRNFSDEEEYCKECVSLCENNVCSIRGGESSTVESAATAALDAVTPYGIPLNAWKVIFQIFLTFINVAFWLFPLKSKKMTENKLVLSIANSFSGGVFLSLAFGHLLPECTHGFRGMNEAIPYMLALSGYMLIFMVEKVIFDTEHCLESSEKDKNNKEGNAAGAGRGAVILLMALAVHSILEMTALGLADTFPDAALLSLSIALHQPAESIALLVAFIKSGLSESDIIKFLSIFSSMGPIGVVLGMAVNEFAAPIVDSVMLAVVAGTFVYVGATEVIPEEFEDGEHKWKKCLALILGIVSIFGIT
eukprot:CAMPEP_0194247596 /NCGR_PEP_ID=MMETSP0158-20130606/16820_1 /TAXON_ID=33649 /ORGANISM="Thalassionema nitzschioides, Strain L26-B" /LENGTH=397 /DNA_ID=CAMNT_0038983711 /DNA_START=24 /DNA_END=1214 /DNA_ORIENTATION=-